MSDRLMMILVIAAMAIGLFVLAERVDALKAEKKALTAQLAPMEQAVRDAGKTSEGYRTALQACEAEKVRVGDANQNAALVAAQQAADAAAAAEDFLKRMASAPAGCDAIRKVQVCPALMDY